ncbi:MAG: type II secretion system protein N [Pseudomonadota bacterium]
MFLVTAIANAPASLLSPILERGDPLITYERLDGTVWAGELKHLWVEDQYFGTINFRLSPLKLVLGRFEARVRAEGGVGTGEGNIGVGALGQTFRVSDARVVFDLSAVRNYTMFGIPYQGEVRASIKRFVVSREGCRIARSEVWTDMLNAPAIEFLGNALPLEGAAACDGADVALSLTGENASGTAQITIKVTPQLSYEFVAAIDPVEQDLEAQLPLVGFEARGAQFVYDAYGELKGMGS